MLELQWYIVSHFDQLNIDLLWEKVETPLTFVGYFKCVWEKYKRDGVYKFMHACARVHGACICVN